MTPPTWQIPGPDPDEVIDTPPPPLASLHYLRSALRRRRRTWVGLAIVGLVLGIAYSVLRPPASVATTSLMLVHEQGTDPAQAMATDVSILRTRTVAAHVVGDLGLTMTPEDFQSTITVVPVTSDVLALSVEAPDNTAAMARVRALSDAYLSFRAEQVQAQSNALIEGNRQRIAQLQGQAEQLSKQYDALSAGGAGGQQRAADVLTQRSQVVAQISTLQQTNQSTALDTSTLVSASHVLDAPSLVPVSPLKAFLLPAASGLIGGAGLGVGIVLLGALTSTRLRTREEVAVAVGAPVRMSVAEVRGPWRWLRLGSGRDTAARNLDLLVHGLGSACVRQGGRPVRLAVGTLDGSRDVELLVATLGVRLSLAGRSVLLVDLSERGRLEKAVSQAIDRECRQGSPAAAPTVFRPEGVPALARGPLDRRTHPATGPGDEGALRSAWDSADVVLLLADVDPSVGVDELATWAHRMVLVVRSGHSSVERLRTTGELVRSAGLELSHVLLVGADRSDETLGSPDSAAAIQVAEPREASR